MLGLGRLRSAFSLAANPVPETDNPVLYIYLTCQALIS